MNSRSSPLRCYHAKIIPFPIVWIVGHSQMRNAAFVFSDCFISPKPAERWPRLLPSPVAARIRSSTPSLGSLTSNRTALPSWPGSLRERRWTKRAPTKSVGSRGKTTRETAFTLPAARPLPFYRLGLSSERKRGRKPVRCPRIMRMNLKNTPVGDVETEWFIVSKIGGVSTTPPERSNGTVFCQLHNNVAALTNVLTGRFCSFMHYLSCPNIDPAPSRSFVEKLLRCLIN